MAKLSGPESAFNEEQKAKIEAVRARLAAAGALTKQERAEVKAAVAPEEKGSPIPKEIRQQRAQLKELLAEIPAATPTQLAKPGDPNFIGPIPEGSPARAGE